MCNDLMAKGEDIWNSGAPRRPVELSQPRKLVNKHSSWNVRQVSLGNAEPAVGTCVVILTVCWRYEEMLIRRSLPGVFSWSRNTRRKPASAPLSPPQIPHDQTRARTLSAVVGNQRLSPWAMARLCLTYLDWLSLKFGVHKSNYIGQWNLFIGQLEILINNEF
jgi:hypothetical protein